MLRLAGSTQLIGHSTIDKIFNIVRTIVVLIATTGLARSFGGVAFAQRSLLLQEQGALQENGARQKNQAFQENLALRQKRQPKITATWQGQELVVVLHRLAVAGDIPLWLDRRVDRQQIINAQLVDLSLEQAFAILTEKQHLGFVLLDNLVYVGPRQAVQELPTLAQQAHAIVSELPASSRRRWLQPQATSWPRLSEPRSLAIDWLRVAKIELIGSERIAHDLWPAQSLPALPLVDRLVLLLTGFDLTCQISPNGKSCEVVSIERPLKLVEPLPVRQAKRRNSQPRRKPQSTVSQRFSLRLQNQPLGAVLDQFAQQLQLEVVWQGVDSSQRNSLRKRLVTCDVQNVELDELLRSILASMSVQHHLEGKQVTLQVRP